MIGTLFAGYKLIEKLGGRSNGIVYRAYDPKGDQFVAIKILERDLFYNDEKKGRFLREAQTAVILEHENIARLYELGDFRGTEYIVMEFIDGKTFTEILEAHENGVSLKAFSGMVQPIINALAYAHSIGVVHRDLKPDNLILDKFGSPVIVDFGLSKTSDMDHPDSGYITSKGMVLGSPGYMSPEQVTAQVQDHRTDIFAIGVIMYELLNGVNPFSDDSPIKAMQKIMNEEPLTLELIRPDLPPGLVGLITKCIQKDPDNRFAKAKTLYDEIIRVLDPFCNGNP